MTTTDFTQRKRVSLGRWTAGIAVIAAIIAAAVALTGATSAPAAASAGTVSVLRGDIVATVAGSGSTEAARTINLSFQTSGNVTEVLVAEGEDVAAGQALARLDDRLLRLQVTNAEASLASAQAQLDALRAGPSTADLTAAQVSVANAEVQLQRVTDDPAAADVAAARSNLITAQDRLAELQGGSDPDAIQNARNALEQARNSLWAQQLARDAACVQPSITCDQANATVGNGEIAVRQAQATLDDLLAGPSQADLQVADLAVQQAAARLADLRTLATAKEIEAAELQFRNAQARLDDLIAGAKPEDLARAEASVSSAQLALAQARDALDRATLRAPFAGVVAVVNLTPGEQAGGAATAIQLVDRSALHIELTLSENDVMRVQPGQPVTVTVGTSGSRAPAGTVSFVAPAAQTNSGVVTYVVRIALTGDTADVKVGMTADVAIVTAERHGVLLVPTTALLPKGTARVVQVVSPDGAVREAEVQIGLADATHTEILSGLNEGDRIIALPDNGTQNTKSFSGPFGGGM